MKHFFYILFLLFILNACGSAGGVEAGNPPDLPTTRNVIGTLTGPGASITATSRTIGDDCGADTLIATNSLAETITASVGSDCSFSITLDIGKAYALALLKDDTFIASFIFNNTLSTISSITLIIADGTDDIDLGNITINGNRASCELEIEQEDNDCDLDGYPDGFDDDESCDDNNDEGDGGSDDETDASILEVSPRNGENEVSIDEEIEVRFACTLDEATVNNTTFSITDDLDNTISCTFDIEDDQVSCEHATNFDLNTVYTVTLSGITCNDATEIPETSWSFTTETEND
ncbi:Ig-like domain-containing protein [bacterium]|nr:Ig-like domain-containing protein [bacterium]